MMQITDKQINTPPHQLGQKPSDGQRVVWLDVLRVVATIGVILLHVGGTDFHLPVGEHDWYIAVVFDSLVRWSVPMFVMISGALFLNPAKEITIHITIKKYAARLIKVYLFWYLTYLVINTAYTSLLQGFFNWDAISLVPQFHLWFLLMLAGVYLLIPITNVPLRDV